MLSACETRGRGPDCAGIVTERLQQVLLDGGDGLQGSGLQRMLGRAEGGLDFPRAASLAW